MKLEVALFLLLSSRHCRTHRPPTGNCQHIAPKVQPRGDTSRFIAEALSKGGVRFQVSEACRTLTPDTCFTFGQIVFWDLKCRKQRFENWGIRRREKVPFSLYVISSCSNGTFCHVDNTQSAQIISMPVVLVNSNLAQVVQK